MVVAVVSAQQEAALDMVYRFLYEAVWDLGIVGPYHLQCRTTANLHKGG
jgi:hypothetical protein